VNALCPTTGNVTTLEPRNAVRLHVGERHRLIGGSFRHVGGIVPPDRSRSKQRLTVEGAGSIYSSSFPASPRPVDKLSRRRAVFVSARSARQCKSDT
jgi:hypothetical protein